jgi:hypothetical protein
VILTLRRLRQEDHRFQASLGYINETLSQKEKKKRKEKENQNQPSEQTKSIIPTSYSPFLIKSENSNEKNHEKPFTALGTLVIHEKS